MEDIDREKEREVSRIGQNYRQMSQKLTGQIDRSIGAQFLYAVAHIRYITFNVSNFFLFPQIYNCKTERDIENSGCMEIKLLN